MLILLRSFQKKLNEAKKTFTLEIYLYKCGTILRKKGPHKMDNKMK